MTKQLVNVGVSGKEQAGRKPAQKRRMGIDGRLNNVWIRKIRTPLKKRRSVSNGNILKRINIVLILCIE